MPSPSRRPQQGEIWLADLSPPVGHEQARPPRPVLIVSGAIMNRAAYDLSFAVPLTTNIKRLPGHVFLAAADSGLRADSEIMCEHLRAISHRRFKAESPIGRVGHDRLKEVVQQISQLMEP